MSTAQERYAQLSTTRFPFLFRARECAKITIPAMMPPEGHTGYQRLPTPWQATGARCVNSIAARTLLALFPPSATFFKLTIDDYAVQQITGGQAARGDVEKALNKIERAVCAEIETSTMRPALFEALKHLFNAGNVLLHMPDDGSVRVFRLDRYVVKRDPSGNVLEIITHEMVSPLTVPDSMKTHLPDAPQGKNSPENYLNLYTYVQRTAEGWSVYQEIEGKVVPRSRGKYPADRCPWLALRLSAIDCEDYGRGLTEEYLGDFKSLEALTKAITQGAAAAAKVLFLVKPNGSTKPKVIAQAESGDVKEGNAEDVSVLQTEKHADFQVAMALRQALKEDLSFAFLLNSAIQRSGERVTAEEIRYMAQELETGLGGIYSNLSQELQLPLVILLMNRLEKQKRLPKLPRKLVKPAITTGLDAIGRGNDTSRLSNFMNGLANVDKTGGIIQRNINEPELVKRFGVGNGIDMDGLVKTDAQLAADKQQQIAQEAMTKLGPNAINAMAKTAQQPK